MSSRKRTFLKCVSWEIIAWLLTLFIALLVTGDITESWELATALIAPKIVCMYLHERVWK